MLKVVTGGGGLGVIGTEEDPGSVGDFVEQAAASAAAISKRCTGLDVFIPRFLDLIGR
ncbi:MAG TPA: hypothetical protein VN912_06955 [Candidatus Angelobacter sp.]|nr:hypothetical protein [Candidatus Angelobacter sp.]